MIEVPSEPNSTEKEQDASQTILSVLKMENESNLTTLKMWLFRKIEFNAWLIHAKKVWSGYGLSQKLYQNDARKIWSQMENNNSESLIAIHSRQSNLGKTSLCREQIRILENFLSEKNELSYWRYWVFCNKPIWMWEEDP